MSSQQSWGDWIYLPYKHLGFFIFILGQLCKAYFTSSLCVCVCVNKTAFYLFHNNVDLHWCPFLLYSICPVGIPLNIGLSFVIKIKNRLFSLNFFPHNLRVFSMGRGRHSSVSKYSARNICWMYPHEWTKRGWCRIQGCRYHSILSFWSVPRNK